MADFWGFSCVLNNAWVWRWPVCRPKLVALEITNCVDHDGLLNQYTYWSDYRVNVTPKEKIIYFLAFLLFNVRLRLFYGCVTDWKCCGVEMNINTHNIQIWCDFDRASSLICGNKMPTRCNRGFYCRSYFLHLYSTKYHRQQPPYNTLELLMMGIVVPETCWASNKICNKNLCCI